MIDRMTQRSRGFGFVMFADKRDQDAGARAGPGKHQGGLCQSRSAEPGLGAGAAWHACWARGAGSEAFCLGWAARAQATILNSCRQGACSLAPGCALRR